MEAITSKAGKLARMLLAIVLAVGLCPSAAFAVEGETPAGVDSVVATGVPVEAPSQSDEGVAAIEAG